MGRKLQLLIGLVLAIGCVVGVLLFTTSGKPVTYPVPVVKDEIAAYTELTGDMFAVDEQMVQPAIVKYYVTADELAAMLAQTAVAVENLHKGQPLLRAQVATGVEAEGISRLAVALDNPNQVILSIPVDQDTLPALVPGDVVALFFSAGQIQAHTLVTYTVTGGEEEDGSASLTAGDEDLASGDEPVVIRHEDGSTLLTTGGPVTTTHELELAMTKWWANGVVYRLNREKRENPNYGAPGMEGEPRYIEGKVKSLDIVVDRREAEWVAFGLAHGRIQVGVLPALAKTEVETGAYPSQPGVFMTDVEDRIWQERAGGLR